MNRSRALALLSAVALGFSTASPGCAGEADAPAATALRDAFPKEAARVLGSRSESRSPAIGLIEPLEGRAGEHCSPRLPGRSRFCGTFPARAGEAVVFSLEGGGGFEMRVREEGAFGELLPAEDAIAYRRAGGFAFWTKTPEGFEEWLLLEADQARPDRPAASWIIEGAEVRQLGEVLVVVGPDGVARLRVAAPASFAASGRPLSARLVAASPSRVDLYVDGGGERVLVDPSWTPTEAMLVPRQNGRTVKLPSGQVLLAGGEDFDGNVTLTEIYDPPTNIWLPAGDLKAGNVEATITLLASGKVLVTGGFSGSVGMATWLSTTQLFNPATKVWTVAAPLLQKRAYHAAVRLENGTIFVVGGTNGKVAVTSTEIYDPATNQWSAAAPTSVPRAGHNLTLLPSGKVLVTGGEMQGLIGAKTVEMYDPIAGSWSIVAPLKHGRIRHATLVLPDGRVLLAGINELVDIDTTEAGPDDAEIYDPKANTWTSTSLMPRRAWGVTLTQLKSGKVLLTHREVQPKKETFAQIYDPESDVWTITKPPAYSHTVADATPLDNGHVLLVGGYLPELPPVSELYDPGDPLGAPCSIGDDCESGFCVEGICCDRACDGGQCEACSIKKGAPADGVCSRLTGSQCDDGDPCSLKDTCGADGVCGGAPRVCEPLNECHEAGACDPATGLCLSPQRPDGSACGEGGLCSEGRCVITESTTSGGSLLPNPMAPVSCGCRTKGAPSSAAPAVFIAVMAVAAIARSRASRRAPTSRSHRRGTPSRY